MKGELVRLRGYEKSDAGALLQWFSDEEVTDFVGPTEYPTTRAAQESFIESAARPDAVTMGIIRNDYVKAQ